MGLSMTYYYFDKAVGRLKNSVHLKPNNGYGECYNIVTFYPSGAITMLFTFNGSIKIEV